MITFLQASIISAIAGISAIVTAAYYYHLVKKQDAGNNRMQEIASYIQEGSDAFLKRQYKTIATVIAIFAALLLIFLPEPIWTTKTPTQNIISTLAFGFGAASSALAGFVGMRTATKANVRTTSAARKGLNKAFKIAFRGGSVMGLWSAGSALLGIAVILIFTGDPRMILGFSIGASLLTLFAKAGGGIYTKTADVCADIVGKVEMDFPEDDPRNPAVIADMVGDNVGDVAGTGADLFDSYVATILVAMLLAVLLGSMEIAIIYASLGIVSSIVSIAFVRVGENGDPGKALNRGTYLNCFTFGALTLFITLFLRINLRIWGAVAVGIGTGIVIGITSDYYTSINRSPAKKTAEASRWGAAINILTGFSYGLESTVPVLWGIGIATASGYFLAGEFGIAISALGMLGTVGMTISVDAYGPVSDNAQGIAEMTGLKEEVTKVTNELDAAGNTTKAISKGFAIGAAGMTAVALFITFNQIVINEIGVFNGFLLSDPRVWLGLCLGAPIPYLFSARVIMAVSENASIMMREVNRQLLEIPGLREGKKGVKPQYSRCVDIATKAAHRSLIPQILISIGTTLAVGFIFGIVVLAGFLAGCTIAGLLLAFLSANAGGLWDNAKKKIEDGYLGGKGSDAHKASIIADAVGDPFKDTAGPSLNTLITLMTLISSLFAQLIIRYNLPMLLGV